MTNNISPNEISAEALLEKIKAGELLTIIDLRLTWNFKNNGHIPGAISIPLSKLANRLDEIPKDYAVILQCVHGKNSDTAFWILMDAGWAADKVFVLKKGIGGWIRAYGRKTLV